MPTTKEKMPFRVGIGHSCLRADFFAEWMKSVTKQLKKYEDRFDTIVCRGKSGMLAAGYLAVVLKKNIIIVRKTTTNAHSSGLVEYHEDPKKYIIVDDFISSGATVNNIFNKMNIAFPSAELFAIALYDSDDSCVNCYHDQISNRYDSVRRMLDTVPFFTPDFIYNEYLLHLGNRRKKK